MYWENFQMLNSPHALILHGLCQVSGPRQSGPEHTRDWVSTPAPQVFEHEPHAPHWPYAEIVWLLFAAFVCVIRVKTWNEDWLNYVWPVCKLKRLYI